MGNRLTNHLKTRRREFWLGIRHVLNVPALGIFFSMTGFAAIARDAGFDLTQAMVTTALVWGMPGQVAMASLYASGASAVVIFSAVAIANMRMMLMTVSGIGMLGVRNHSFFVKVFLVQLLAITGWIQLAVVKGMVERQGMLTYYLSFSLVLYTCGLLGTVAGYYLIDFLPIPLVKTVVFTTPLYILMMVARVREAMFRQAGAIGAVLGPSLTFVIGEGGIFVGGFLGGTLVMLPKLRAARRAMLARRNRHKNKKRRQQDKGGSND